MKKVIQLQFFSGFYNSIHSAAFDNELDEIMMEENCEYDDLEYTYNYENYCSEYVNAFNSEYKFNLEFEKFSSPREYNFTTDRLFCFIDDNDLAKLATALNSREFAVLVMERFTSRDGFSSFYSNNIAEWLAKPLADYDHNELGTLLDAYLEIETECSTDSEKEIDYTCYEYAAGNGAASIDYEVKKEA